MTPMHPAVEGPFSLEQVSLVPKAAGVYAWYSVPYLYKKDLEDFERAVTSIGDETARAQFVRCFLDGFLFCAFKETPYRVSVQGPLKPTYRGEVPHVPSISESLVKRITLEPKRLSVLADVLKTSIPIFASPIYIGMARSLRKRLSQHKKLISELLENSSLRELAPDARIETQQDHSFAYEAIVIRRLNPNNLSVYVRSMDIEKSPYILDVENVLNRLYYPLCGRN